MKEIISCLEGIPEGEAVYVIFIGGDEFEFMNCECVDESIENRTDLMLADVKKKVVGDKRFHTPGTKLQFSVCEVQSVSSVPERTMLYESTEDT